MEDDLLCRMLCNPSRINKNSMKHQNYDQEVLKLLKRKFPKHIINLSDIKLIYDKIEEIHKINLIKELVENAINGAITKCIEVDNRSNEK
tara:strand:+ start:248 stop:517 length:270 start_codon:yes stop_codon:yes gene_type:complete